MRNFLSLFSCWFLASTSSFQTPTAGFPDTPTIAENSVGRARIGMPVSELKLLYKGYSFEPRSMAVYGYKRKDFGLCVKFKDRELFVADIHDSKVWGLYALDSHYKTSKGMYVGATAYMLKKALPGLKVEHAIWDYALQVVTNSKEESVNYWFKSAEDLGNYDEVKNLDPIVSKQVSLKASTAIINWIEVTMPPI